MDKTVSATNSSITEKRMTVPLLSLLHNASISKVDGGERERVGEGQRVLAGSAHAQSTDASSVKPFSSDPSSPPNPVTHRCCSPPPHFHESTPVTHHLKPSPYARFPMLKSLDKPPEAPPSPPNQANLSPPSPSTTSSQEEAPSRVSRPVFVIPSNPHPNPSHPMPSPCHPSIRSTTVGSSSSPQ